MTIIDINGKERDIQSIKIVTQEGQQYVEVIINGKSGRAWKEWYPLKDFKKMNPNFSEKLQTLLFFGDEK